MSLTEATSTPSGPPSVADLQAQVESARADLLASIADLKAQTTPGALMQRGGRNVAGWFTDEYGGVRPERVAIAGAVVIGAIALRLIVRRRR